MHNTRQKNGARLTLFTIELALKKIKEAIIILKTIDIEIQQLRKELERAPEEKK